MEIKELQSNMREVTTDIICDSCGQSCKVFDGIVRNQTRLDYGEKSYEFESMSLKANWGFWSKHDCEEWTAHICEKCVIEKLTPIINFQKKDYI
jgi:hypothetical protein